MKKLLLFLLFPAGLIAMQPSANPWQQFVGKAFLRIKNKTNNNYRITTSQSFDEESRQLIVVPANENPNPLDSGISAKTEKIFPVTLNAEPGDEINPSSNFFSKHIAVIDAAGLPQAEINITQGVLHSRSQSDFRTILYLVQTDTDIDDRVNAKLSQGMASFQILIILDGDKLEKSSVDITAVQ
jgi:hypothetical protein